MDALRVGSYLRTYNGGKFWPLDPEPADIDIVDIAHALALTNRFNGHTREPYSVAQHSVLVHDAIYLGDGPQMRLTALLHDAAEAYIMVRPLKHAPGIAGYRLIDDQITAAIMGRYSGIWPLPEAVKAADEIALRTEQRDLVNGAEGWKDGPTLMRTITPWRWVDAEAAFLRAFAALADVHGERC